MFLFLGLSDLPRCLLSGGLIWSEREPRGQGWDLGRGRGGPCSLPPPAPSSPPGANPSCSAGWASAWIERLLFAPYGGCRQAHAALKAPTCWGHLTSHKPESGCPLSQGAQPGWSQSIGWRGLLGIPFPFGGVPRRPPGASLCPPGCRREGGGPVTRKVQGEVTAVPCSRVLTAEAQFSSWTEPGASQIRQ